MNTKQSPRKVTLAMIKGKPITTSVPVIHYHASDDELEEIYPSADKAKGLTPECETNALKITSTSSKSIEKRSVHESDVSENNSETRSVGTENVLPEGTPPSLDPWKVLSDIKGKITKTFGEKLSEIKSDKKKRRNSKAESSSVSDVEEQGSITPSEKKVDDKQVNDDSTTMISRHQRGNPVRYVGFSDVTTGLKDKSLQDESVESGIEASEFAQTINEDTVSCLENDFSTAKASPNRDDDYATLQHQSCTRFTAFPKRIDFKTAFLRLMRQLILQTTYKSVAIFIAIFSIYYVAPLPEYLLGFIMGIFATVTFYSTLTKFQRLLTTVPDENLVSASIIPVLEIPAAEEHSVIERFQGWLNELPYNYEPNNYHVARTKSVFFRLEGNILRIMETRMKIPKKAVWDEPKHKLKFVRRRVYNLSGARIELVPCGLARKRRWSKKYPICITLKKTAVICNVTLKNSVNDECSMNDYYRKRTAKGRMKYRSDRKRVTNWGEEKHSRHESSLINEEGDESTMKQGRRKEEEKDVEDDGEDSYCNYDTTNDDIDNEYVEYEECFLKDEGLTEYTVGEERRGKDRIYKKGLQKDVERIRRNVRRSYNYIDNRRKKIEKKLEARRDWKGEEKEQDEKEEENKKEKNGEDGYEEDKNEEVEVIGNKLEIDDDEEDEEEEEEYEEIEEMDYEEFYLENDELDEERDDYDDEDDDYDEYDNDDDDNDDEDDDDDDDEEVNEDQQPVNDDGKDEHVIGEGDKGNGKEARTKVFDNDDCGIDIEKDGEIKGEGIELMNLKSAFKKLNKKSKQKSELKVFIFARADREKEDWYRRLVSAASRRVKKHNSLSFNASSTLNTSLTSQKNVIAESKGSLSSNSSHEKSVPELSYTAYMAKYLDAGGSSSSKLENAATDNTLWFNCLIARIMFDIHKCPETISLIQDKIQRKLSSIKLPYFMECLLVSEVTIGQGAPTIRSITTPIVNERGLWLDFDLMYKGSLTMTVETKLNLMKLTRTGSVPSNSNVVVPTEKHESIVRSAIFDSDLEDTPETSTEDEDDSTTRSYNTAKETTGTQSSGRKFLSMVDKIAASKYFQHATELSYVRRAMEGVSNMEIRLMVTVSSIEGCLSVNIPPAPSDRLWYGFKPVPKVTLTVKPVLGERTVNIVYVTKWIEAKLLREFEKLVVLPNMDDLVVPLCPNYPYTTTR